MVVEIPGGRIAARSREIPVGSATVRRVRLNQLRRGAQVVLDLAERRPYAHFSVAPDASAGAGHRIVVDIAEPAAVRSEPAANADSAVTPAVTPDAAPAQDDLAARERPFLVVVDPGHGGEDPGALGPKRLREKTVTLRIARELAQRLDGVSGVRARLTRAADGTVSLSRRQEMVAEWEADLLVSVHANASPSRKTRGGEVFHLSMDSYRAERDRALRHAPPGEPLAAILDDLSLAEGMMLSGRLARSVSRTFADARPIPVLRVKQAGFQVLKLRGVPAVLFEVGYLSNAGDAKHLADAAFAKATAERLASALVSFLRQDYRHEISPLRLEPGPEMQSAPERAASP